VPNIFVNIKEIKIMFQAKLASIKYLEIKIVADKKIIAKYC